MRFVYKAQAADGQVLQGELEASDSHEAVKQLAKRGAVPLALTKAAEPIAFFRRRRLNERALTSLLSELALILRSGVPLDEALTLASIGLPAAARNLVKSLREDLLAGKSMAQALERQAPDIPADLVAMTRVGEASGKLDVVFESVAKERERAHRLAEKIRSALAYPLFLIVSALSVLLFFLLHVIPQFSSVFDGSQNDPGVLVRDLLALSTWLSSHELELALFAVGAALLIALVIGNASSRAVLARAFLRIPMIGRIWMSWRTSRFLANFSLLLSQGIGGDEAVKILQDTIGSEGREPLARAYDEIRRGSRFSEALKRTKLFDEFVERVLRIGEETGEMPRMASEAASLYSHNLERRLDVLTSVIGPAAILSIALLIGGIMALIMSALMSVDQAVY